MNEKRKRYTGAEIMAILREHLVEGKSISEVCAKAGIHPKMFYRWRSTLLEGGAAVFDRKGERATAREGEVAQAKIDALEQRLQKKHEVLSELMEEHVALKKTLGGP